MFRHSLFKPLHLMGEAFAAGAGTKFFWATTRVRDKELTFFICIRMLTELSTHGIVGTRYKNLVPLRWTGRFIRVTLNSSKRKKEGKKNQKNKSSKRRKERRKKNKKKVPQKEGPEQPRLVALPSSPPSPL